MFTRLVRVAGRESRYSFSRRVQNPIFKRLPMIKTFSTSEEHAKKLDKYLVGARGLTPAEAQAVAETLAADGNIPERDRTAFIDSLPRDALQSFVDASTHIKDREEERNAKKSISLTVNVPAERHSFTLEAKEGETLFDLVMQGTELAYYLECACGGIEGCSTCHVYLKEFDSYSEPDESEMDMVDLAYEPKDNSRLGCRLHLTLDHTHVEVPEDANNLH